MDQLKKIIRNYSVSEEVCKGCDSDLRTWNIEVIEILPSGLRKSTPYFYCFSCDQRD